MGWSTGFMATPLTVGRTPIHRFRPALPRETFSCPTFPTCPIGAKNDEVKMTAGAGPIAGEAAPTKAWNYGYECGEFVVNSDGATNSDAAVNYDDL